MTEGAVTESVYQQFFEALAAGGQDNGLVEALRALYERGDLDNENRLLDALERLAGQA